MANRHHYVPQAYLRRFEAQSGKVWLYDKSEDRVVRPGPTAIINVGQEKGFYALPDDPNYPDDDPEIFEKQLAAFEAGFIESMDVAVRIADEGGVGNLDERIRLSKTIAFQHLRTRAWRDGMSHAYRSLQEWTLNVARALAYAQLGRKPPSEQIVVEVEEERAWALQARAMWVDGSVDKIAEGIYFSIWITALNSSDRPFITSDSPVVAETVASQRPDGSKQSSSSEWVRYSGTRLS